MALLADNILTRTTTKRYIYLHVYYLNEEVSKSPSVSVDNIYIVVVEPSYRFER